MINQQLRHLTEQRSVLDIGDAHASVTDIKLLDELAHEL